jgi:hypothetical protein
MRDGTVTAWSCASEDFYILFKSIDAKKMLHLTIRLISAQRLDFDKIRIEKDTLP